MRFDIDVQGVRPLVDGRATRGLDRAVERGETDVAQDAFRRVHARLARVLEHPTGRYQSTVDVVHTADPYVEGEGTVYGRWLEGESSRNRETRFKGYATFRRVALDVERASGDIMEDRVDHWARSV